MSHLDNELTHLKQDVLEMWELVKNQISKGKVSLQNRDKNLAREIVMNEKRVNAYELKIDKDCENIFALFNPVAVDLRMLLAVLKINNNLERIGDIGEGVAKFVIDIDTTFDPTLIEQTRVIEMFAGAELMIQTVMDAFEQEDTALARTIFQKDEILDEINGIAAKTVAEYIRQNPDKIEGALNVLSIIRKLERIGDQSKNIGEEIIFFIEAKVLKHKGKGSKKAEF